MIANSADGTQPMSVGKGGTGTWSLTAANTYGVTTGTVNGTTTVSNGKLLLRNTTGSATGTSAVIVGITPTAISGNLSPLVGGTGTSYGLFAANSVTNVTDSVASTAAIAPGLNPVGSNFGVAGTLGLGTGGTIGSATTAGGMTLTGTVLDFDLASTATGLSDKILTGGTFTATGVVFTFNELLASTLDTNAAYTLISGFTNTPDISTITGVVLAGNYAPTFSLNGNALQVSFTSVPEPMALGLFGFAGLMIGRRRRVA